MIAVFSLSMFLMGCSTTKVIKDSGPSRSMDVSTIKDAVPRKEAKSKQGNMSSYVVFGKRYYVLDSSENFKEKGMASWYGNKFHGNKTSNGEIYDMYAMTAAHKRLPLPSYVKVTNLNNNKSVVVRVNDRGPFHKGRIIDLSFAAASKLGIDKVGTAPVEISVVGNKSNSTPVVLNSDKSVMSGKGITSTKDSIAVQVGAFSIRSSAEKVKQQLSQLVTTKVTVSEVISRGKKLFRVRLGPFNDIATANRWLSKVDKLSFGSASLVYL